MASRPDRRGTRAEPRARRRRQPSCNLYRFEGRRAYRRRLPSCACARTAARRVIPESGLQRFSPPPCPMRPRLFARLRFRRTFASAKRPEGELVSVWLEGGAYNLCEFHSLFALYVSEEESKHGCRYREAQDQGRAPEARARGGVFSWGGGHHHNSERGGGGGGEPAPPANPRDPPGPGGIAPAYAGGGGASPPTTRSMRRSLRARRASRRFTRRLPASPAMRGLATSQATSGRQGS